MFRMLTVDLIQWHASHVRCRWLIPQGTDGRRSRICAVSCGLLFLQAYVPCSTACGWVCSVQQLLTHFGYITGIASWQQA